MPAPFWAAIDVDLFPAWETLPFERVSPGVETMGRRLRAMWRLRQPDRPDPTCSVAPVRALVQRLGPHVEEVEPVVVRPGETHDPDELVERLVRPATAASTRSSIGARSPCAARSSTSIPSTADGPCASTCGATRSTASPSSPSPTSAPPSTSSASRSSGCRELAPDGRGRERAEALIASEPWGREQWERLANGLTFDGMESWLPWLTESEHVLLDLLPPDAASSCSSSPAACATAPPKSSTRRATWPARWRQTWGAAARREFPRLHVPFDRLLAHTDGAGVVDDGTRPKGRAPPTIEAAGWDPVVGDGDGADQPAHRPATAGLPHRRVRRRRGLRPTRIATQPARRAD